MDGVVISRREPTIHISFPEFIGEMKGGNMPVKIETNGSHPEMSRELIEEELLDSVIMDIKNKDESNKYERTHWWKRRLIWRE
ncbi:MAG: hypothetical protein ACE5IT_04925 [bacterium]